MSATPSGASRVSRIAICVLEPLPRNRRHRFWRAGRAGRMVLPRDRTGARRRQSRTGSRAPDRAQRPGELQHDSPRFVVDREAMAGRSYRRTRGTVCRPGLLWKRAIRDVLHHRPNGLCVGQLVDDLRDLQSVRDASRGNSHRTDRPSLSEIDGDGRRSVARYKQPNRICCRSSVGVRSLFRRSGSSRVGSQHRHPSTTSRAERIFRPLSVRSGLQSRRLHGAASPTPVSGNYLLYWKASQAL